MANLSDLSINCCQHTEGLLLKTGNFAQAVFASTFTLTETCARKPDEFAQFGREPKYRTQGRSYYHGGQTVARSG